MRHSNRTRTIAVTLSLSILFEAIASPVAASTVWADRSSKAKTSSQQLA